MKYTKDINLTNFEFWSGAEDHKFTNDELEMLEYTFEDLYYNTPPTETEINDMFWFEEQFLCDSIGLKFDEYENR
jgi:hypothetical protein